MRIRGGKNRILQAATDQQQHQLQLEQVKFSDPSQVVGVDGLHHQVGDLVQNKYFDSGLSDRKPDHDDGGFFRLSKPVVSFQEMKKIKIKDQEVDSNKINFTKSSRSFGAKRFEKEVNDQKKKLITFPSSATSITISDRINNNTSSSSNSITAGRKRRSPAVLMEGSRCSRINGRGWRCSQLTLVGYSLCEHHLGKGRLRSVTNNVQQLGSSKNSLQETDGIGSGLQQLSAAHAPAAEQDDDGRLMQVVVAKKKRNKIGVVKARSISSLLDIHDQDQSEFANADPEPPLLQQLAEVAGVHGDHSV